MKYMGFPPEESTPLSTLRIVQAALLLDVTYFLKEWVVRYFVHQAGGKTQRKWYCTFPNSFNSGLRNAQSSADSP
jgi:hypothetical protein